jgi:hypothetical protein
MNRLSELRIEHERLLSKVMKDILADGMIMDKQQLELFGTLAKSKAFIQGYTQGYKDAYEEFEHKS